LPVQSLARISATEESQSFSAERATEGTCIATSAEIANAFESVNSVGYSEPTHLQGKCTGLTITPFGAGHSLGGTIWKIRSPSSGTLIYGVDLNHTKERCLDGTVLLKSGGQGSGLEVFEPLARPDVFITDASRILVTSARRTDREKAFLQNITDTLTDHHSVLIPSDLDSRLLEMLILLDHHWSFSKMRYPLCLVSRNGEAYLKETIPSLMEWFGGVVGAGVASDSVGDDTGRRRHEHETLLKFRNLEFFARPEHLIKKYSSRDPKVIIAVPFSMSYGPARKIFVENGIGEGHGNLVLLTRQDQSESWASNLIRRWSDEQPATTDSIGTMIPLEEQQTLKVRLLAK
jgi:cleavage and polyadenylation specificity factor subunit 2